MKITDEPRPSIAFIGECMVEIREDVNDHIEQAFAGDTLNTAVYLARLLPASEYLIHYITITVFVNLVFFVLYLFPLMYHLDFGSFLQSSLFHQIFAYSLLMILLL